MRAASAAFWYIRMYEFVSKYGPFKLIEVNYFIKFQNVAFEVEYYDVKA